MFKIKGYLPRTTVRAAVKTLKGYNGVIADIGCGKGELLKELGTDNKRSFIGLDIAWDQVAKARAAGLPVVLGDASFMPFKDTSFDAVTCLNTIYNFRSLDELKPAFKEIARILRKNGRIVLDIRNKRNPIIMIKAWMHNKKKKFPTVPHVPESLIAAMKSFGLRLVRKDAVGINTALLAWGYILVFEKETGQK